MLASGAVISLRHLAFREASWHVRYQIAIHYIYYVITININPCAITGPETRRSLPVIRSSWIPRCFYSAGAGSNAYSSRPFTPFSDIALCTARGRNRPKTDFFHSYVKSAMITRSNGGEKGEGYATSRSEIRTSRQHGSERSGRCCT